MLCPEGTNLGRSLSASPVTDSESIHISTDPMGERTSLIPQHFAPDPHRHYESTMSAPVSIDDDDKDVGAVNLKAVAESGRPMPDSLVGLGGEELAAIEKRVVRKADFLIM